MIYHNLNNNSQKDQIKKTAFSLIELSVVVLIIGILIAGITAGSRLVRNSKLASAAQFTKSSDVNSIPDLVLWLEPTQENSFATTSTNSGNLNYANVASLQDANYIKDTLRPDNREYIARWNDITPRAFPGNKKSVYQEIAAQRPMYIANAINGLPAIQFDGSTQYLYSQNNATTPSAPPLVAGDDSYTMIAVFSPSRVTAHNPILEQTPYNPVNGTTFTMYILNEKLIMSGYNNPYDIESAFSMKNEEKYIAIIKSEDSSILSTDNLLFYLNNALDKKTFSTTNHSIGGDSFLLSGYVSSGTSVTRFFQGYIGEVMVFDRALKNEEIDIINKYLSKKWGIALK